MNALDKAAALEARANAYLARARRSYASAATVGDWLACKASEQTGRRLVRRAREMRRTAAFLALI